MLVAELPSGSLYLPRPVVEHKPVVVRNRLAVERNPVVVRSRQEVAQRNQLAVDQHRPLVVAVHTLHSGLLVVRRMDRNLSGVDNMIQS